MASTYLLLTVLLFINSSTAQNPCVPKDFGYGSVVCVCNSTYCDFVGPLPRLNNTNKFLVYTSNAAGLRFKKTVGTFGRNIFDGLGKKKKASLKKGHKNWKKLTRSGNLSNTIRLNYKQTYQKVIGIGGAFTDSTGINIKSLKNGLGMSILKSYFSDDGISYDLARIPIGATDFSASPYTYDDGPEDKTLQNFALNKADFDYKIPLIKIAMNMSGNKLQFYGSAWAAPKWMKTNNDYVGGSIKTDMYQSWASYHLKFLQEYQKQGIPIWGITTGNEPSLAVFPMILTKVPSNGWTPQNMRKWISENLGPTIRNSNQSHVKIMIIDDQRIFIPVDVNIIFQDNKTRNYVDGIAVHWYLNFATPSSLLTLTHNLYPEKFILSTEACEGASRLDKGVRLGSWTRGENYAKDIIDNFQHWVTGWVDWNMALNMEGGPTYVNNFVDSPIIVNAEKNEFYKQPMYYALGHFSKFVPRNSVRVDVSPHPFLDIVGFKRPDNGTVIVILNRRKMNYPLAISQDDRDQILIDVFPNSITTVIHW